MMFRNVLVTLCLLITVSARAHVWLPSIFSDHMVLQRDMKNPVWGTAHSGETVKVRIADQVHATTANEDGMWVVILDRMPAGGPHEMTVTGGNTVVLKDILVGEVWFCSGQSNMEWPLAKSKHAAQEISTATFPEIRLMTISRKAAQTPQSDFEGAWQVCSPETVKDFSAVGYLFGRRLHQELGVPIGLVDNAWGGSKAEAWMPREVLEQDERSAALLAEWDAVIAKHDPEAFATKVEEVKQARAEWKRNGRKGPHPGRVPRDPVTSRKRPCVIYNGVLAPAIGYGMRGFIWYQGESNTDRPGDAEAYRDLFPLLIQAYREKWGQGDFPFYWAQLANYRARNPEPEDTRWAWIRESQTLTLDKVSNSGQAVILDAGNARSIHPKDKQTVADRLVRIALARDYGIDVAYKSPRYDSMKVDGKKIILTFKDVTEGLHTADEKEPVGFAIAGEDRVFKWAKAKMVDNTTVQVWSDEVANPVAVRFAWANNPAFNLYDRSGLPVTPFRTDTWPPAGE